jgi:hypothetical protein
MLAALIGIAIVAASAALLWLLLPKNGVLNRWATAPILESVLPLTIVGGFAIGLCLVALAH